MKQANFLFFLSVDRVGVLSTINKLLLCLLISLGMVTITGCDRDLDVLSEETITIGLPDKTDFDVGAARELTAEVEYEGDDAELKYYWKSTAGTIYGTGEHVTYVAPKDAGTYTIILQVSNGVVTASDFCIVKVSPSEPQETCTTTTTTRETSTTTQGTSTATQETSATTQETSTTTQETSTTTQKTCDTAAASGGG